MKIGYCGDVCSECPRYIATQNNNLHAFEKTAILWHKLGLRDSIVSPADLKCNGCSKELDCAHKINNCVHLNGKNNCGECDLFPCDTISEVFSKTEKFKKICKRKCSEEEFYQLQKAFLDKRKILTGINDKNSI